MKEFHPDVRKDGIDSDTVIRRVIEAYQVLSSFFSAVYMRHNLFKPEYAVFGSGESGYLRKLYLYIFCPN